MGETTFIRELRREYKYPHSYNQSIVGLYRCGYCGQQFEAYIRDFERSSPKACEQCRRELNGRHGESSSRLYRIWTGILQRTGNSNHKYYDKYGGKGVHVCDKWTKFRAFREWALANGYSDELTIDRLDSDGHYEPSNCEWVTPAENNKRMAVRANYGKNASIKLSPEDIKVIYEKYKNGCTQKELAKEYNVSQPTIHRVCKEVENKNNDE